MKPSNEFTSPTVRFFYPDNRGVEHHESLDTTGLPATENVSGEEHYVVVEEAGSETYAVSLHDFTSTLPPSVTIKSVRGQKRKPGVSLTLTSFLETAEFGVFDEDFSYIPQEGTGVIVQIDYRRSSAGIQDPRFDRDGVAILPSGAPLPSFASEGIPDDKVRYRLLGFIAPNDKLVTWCGEAGYPTLLIDWCVANQLKQNRVEEKLLNDALPHGGDLDATVEVDKAAATYLRYYDRKYGTSFFPAEDPRYHSRKKFGRMSEADRRTYSELAKLTHQFTMDSR